MHRGGDTVRQGQPCVIPVSDCVSFRVLLTGHPIDLQEDASVFQLQAKFRQEGEEWPLRRKHPRDDVSITVVVGNPSARERATEVLGRAGHLAFLGETVSTLEPPL